MLEHGDAVRQQEGLAALVLDRHPLVGPVEVLLLAYRQIQRRGIVDGVPHLVDVPVCSQKGGVAYSHIVPETLDLLGVPEREGVVVAVGNEQTIPLHGVEIVLGNFDGGVAVASVVVVPVLLGHQRRHEKTRGGGNGGNGDGVLSLQGGSYP